MRVDALLSSSPEMVNPDVVGLAMEHLLGERLVVLGGPAVRLEGRDGLPLPASLADLGARVDDGLELVVGEVGVEHLRAMALTVRAVPRMTVESSFTGTITMPSPAAAR